MKLSADVIDRPLSYRGGDALASAIAKDPALRSLPSDVIAQRFNVTRGRAEVALRGLAAIFVGDPGPIVGRSFDEVIADAGEARRQASSPAPLREAAGFDAGATAVERMRAIQLQRRPPPGRASFMMRGADGYQTPPIPDLSMLLLSDAFPVTRRTWSRGNTPTDEERVVLNWQHPLVRNATSAQSIATLKAISAGCFSWDTPANVGGNQLGAHSASGAANFWLEMQQIMTDLSGGGAGITYAPNPAIPITPQGLGYGGGRWGLLPPKITANQTDMWYWYMADDAHPYLKMVSWMTQALLKLGPNESVLDATWGKAGGTNLVFVSGGKTYTQPHEGGDLEKDFMKLFAGLGGIVGALTTAVAAAVAVYCPACGAAVKIAGNLAQGAAKGAVSVKALASYGDQLLTDAAIKARNGDSASLSGMRAFASALIGLTQNATQGAQANGGLVKDYLDTLGTAPGNVAWALQVYAQDHSNTIQNAAQLSTKASVPLLDAQYAVAAMTDTLSRFASNVSTIYLDPNMSAADQLLHMHAASRDSLNIRRNLAHLPNIPMGSGRAPSSGPAPVLVVGGAVAAAWYFGLLKGLL